MVWRRRYNYSEKIRFGPWTTPHPSFTASTNIGSISNSVLNLVQSPPGDPPRSFHENASKHKKLDTYRWKDPSVLFNGINKIHSFLHLTLTLDKVTSLHFLRRNTLCLADFGHLKIEENSRHIKFFLQHCITVPCRKLCMLEPFSSYKFALFRTFWNFGSSKSSFHWKPIKYFCTQDLTRVNHLQPFHLNSNLSIFICTKRCNKYIATFVFFCSIYGSRASHLGHKFDSPNRLSLTITTKETKVDKAIHHC